MSKQSQHSPVSSPQTKAIIQLFIAAILWSMGGVLIKGISWSPFAVSGYRSCIAATFLMCVLRKPRFTFSRIEILCAIFFAICISCFVLATKTTTAANAVVLQYTSPIYVALLSGPLLGEKLSRRDWGMLGVVVIGIVLFFFDSLSFSGVFGNFIALVSGFSFGMFTLLLRKQKDASPTESVILGNLLGALIALPWMLDVSFSVADVSRIFVLGTLQLGLAYVLYTEAIKHVTALEAILIPAIEPILNPLFVAFFIGEVPGFWALLGGSLVIGAVLVRGLWQIQLSREKGSSEIKREYAPLD